MRVLIVGADTATAAILSNGLPGLVVDQAVSGDEGFGIAARYDYDAILAELNLVDMDGIAFIQRLRQSNIDTPIIMVTHPGVGSATKINAFRAGADDLVEKTCDSEELVARVRAVIRRSKGHGQPTINIGNLTLNLDSREVSVNGQAIELTGKEFSIVELLAMRSGAVLTKALFLDHLYGGMDEPEMKIIDVFICKVRKKLAQAGAGDLISTVWGRGYMMRAPATEEKAAASAPTKATVMA